MKFEFTQDFQEEILAVVVQDKKGGRLLNKIDDTYFDLTDHAVIAKALKSFQAEFNRVPSDTLLDQRLNEIYQTRELAEDLTNKDRKRISKMAASLYSKKIKHPDIIIKQAMNFRAYIDVSDVISNTDLADYRGYEPFARKIRKAIMTDEEEIRYRPAFLIKDVKDRQVRRTGENPIIPTPWRQVNESTNAGGYARNSIIVILDKPKAFKTGMLINAARMMLRRKKKILYIDLENGEDELMIRAEESIKNKSKREVLSGDLDDSIQRTLRKYRRLGAELAIKRMPSSTTTTQDIADLMDFCRQEYALEFDYLIIDYAGLMGSTTGSKEDTDRIGQVYLDLANLATEYDIEHVYTAHHVKRDAEKREATKYTVNDIAKCIDIVRHVQAIWGLNRSEEEVEQGVFRMEVVEQRDGLPYARALFQVNMETNTANEFTKAQRTAYNAQFDMDSDAEQPNDDLA